MKPARDERITFDVGQRFRIPELPGTPLPRRAFVSTYYDTADRRLTRADVTVRRRLERRRQRWQVSLLQGRARFDLSSREASLSPLRTLEALLPIFTRGSELVPIVTLATRRSGLVMEDQAEPVAEIILDRVAVLEDRRVVRRVRHLEVRPLAGDENALGRIGSLLEKAGATRTEGRSALMRVLGIEAPAVIEPVAETASPVDQIRAMLRAQLASMRAHDPGTRLGVDAEELHQMRTAVRRLRAILRTGRAILDGWTEELRGELDWLGTALGVVRDLDVLRESLYAEIALFDRAEHPAGRRLLHGLDAERMRGREALRAALDDPRYFALVDRLEENLGRPLSNMPAEVVSLPEIAAAAWKKLRKAVDKLPEEPSDEDLARRAHQAEAGEIHGRARTG